MSHTGRNVRLGPLNKVASTYIFNVVLSALLFESVFLSMLTPLPQMYSHLKLGRWAGFSVPLLLFVFISFVGGGGGYVYLIQFALPGIVISEAALRRIKVEQGFALAVAISTIMITFYINSSAAGVGMTGGQAVGKFVGKALQETIAYNEKAGSSPDQMEELKKVTPLIVTAVSGIYHSLIVVGLLITMWVNVLLLGRLMTGWGMSPPFGALSSWKAPEYLVWAVVAGGFLTILGNATLKLIGFNLLLVLCVLYFFQGMAVISYHFNKKGFSGLVKGLAYVFVVWYMGVVVVAIGLFDVWADFRKLVPTNENGEK